jgi:hypothetical protein
MRHGLMGVLDVWLFAELTTEICAESAQKKIVREKAPAQGRQEQLSRPELRGRELRRWLIFFPQQNTSADEPDGLNKHHDAEAVHVEPDMA